MKSFVWVPVALIAGLLIGAWGPRSEVRKCRAEVEELEALLKSGGTGRANPFSGVSRFLRLPEDDTPQPDVVALGTDERDGLASTASPSTTAVVVVGDEGGSMTGRVESAGERQREGFKARLEKAADLWRVRSDVARSAFVAQAELDQKGVETFDVVMAAMNLQLGERIAFWADEFKSGAEMTEETGIRMMNDMSSVLVTTYEEMDAKMPEGWRGQAGSEVSLTDFIDPMVAEPLIGVEDRLQRPPGHRRRPRLFE